MVRWFSRIEGVDYDETFALVARYSSVSVVATIATHMGWRIQQIDTKTTFLNGLFRRRFTLSTRGI